MVRESCVLVVLVVMLGGLLSPGPLLGQVQTPGDPGALAASVAELVVPLAEGDPQQWSDADLRWLDRHASARILAFGEATHGCREFVAARGRIFRYLVEHHGFRVLAVEGHFTESLFLDRCLADATCDLEAAMSERMLFWTTQTREMLAFLEWMRAYNRERPEARRVHYVGIDSQTMDQLEDILSELLDAAEPAILAEVRQALAPLSGLTRSDYEAMDDAQLAEHRQRLFALREQLADAGLEQSLGAHDAESVLRLLVNAYQCLEFLQQYFHHQHLVRDRHLADNVAWATRLLGPETKVVVWAHNAHVAVHREYAADAGGGMGWQLRQRFGERFRCVGLVFSRGEFRAKVFDAAGEVTERPRHVVLAVDPPAGSLNRLLDAAGPGRFFLDLHQVDRESDLGRWLSEPRAVLGVGDLFFGYHGIGTYHYGGDRVMSPLSAFDGIVYLDEPHATEGLR